MQDHPSSVQTHGSTERSPSASDAPRSTVPWDRFRSAFELAPIGMALSSPDGCYQIVNHAFCRLLGRTEEELVGKSYLHFTHPDDRVGNREAVEAALRGGDDRVEFVKRFVRKDERIVWTRVTASLLRDAKGRALSWIVQAQDITEHREATRALQQNSGRLEEAQRIAHLGNWEWHLDTGACVWSAELCRILGGPPDSVQPGIASIIDRVHAEDRERVQRRLEEALDPGGAYVIDHRIEHPDGQVRSVHAEGHIERGPDGRPLRMVGTVQDVTEREEAERKLRASELQLREAQRFESVRRLAGGIAHDFNNLLLVITGHAGLLESQLEEGDSILDEVQAITDAADRAAALTRQLLAFSRRQVLQLRVLDLNSVVSDVEKALRRMIGEDVELITSLADDLGRVRADPGQMEQVLLNLAVNARDAMPDGGRLTITTHDEVVGENETLEGSPLEPGSYVVLSVLDTGCGMDPTTLEQIFEPFFTTKERGKGTGLGLSTVHGIVKQSSGDVRVRSRVGEGTCFSVYLPHCEEEADKPRTPRQRRESPRGTETLLVVEDEEMIHALTMRILKESGYSVLGAQSGEEALKVLQTYRAPIDLLVTDVVMPGMSGPDLVRHARTIRPDMGILYVTGYADHPELVTMNDDGETALLRKPFSPSDLTQCVRQRLEARAHP